MVTTTIPATKQSKAIDHYLSINRALGYTWRMNELTDTIEVNGEPLSDAIEVVIKTELRKAGVGQIQVALEALQAEAWHNRYHPVKDYLNSLSYSGGHHIDQLSSYFVNPDGFFATWIKRWLIGSVRRVYSPGEQNRMLVIDGPQNIGKSKFVEWLCPPGLKMYFKTGAIFPDDKDHRISRASNFIWEVSELGSTTKRSDREALKAFLSAELIVDRKAFGRYDLRKPALVNFVGTVNDEGGLLSDPTGNRRFMFCKVTSIDWNGYLADISIDDIWAEAVMRYYAGEPADLTEGEYQAAETINRTYEIPDPIEDVIDKFFEIDPSQINWFIPAQQILDAVLDPLRGNYKGTTDLASKRITALMVKFGCERKRARVNNIQVRGFQGVKVRI